MSKKYLLLYLVALIVISGCVDKPQTQAEKNGWNQAEYKEYSAFYEHLVNNSPWTGKSLEEVIIDIPKDKNEFEKTWYLTFYYIKKAQDSRPVVKDCSGAYYPDMSPNLWQMRCQEEYRALYSKQVREIYSKATEYRQKIEDMKANLSR